MSFSLKAICDEDEVLSACFFDVVFSLKKQKKTKQTFL